VIEQGRVEDAIRACHQLDDQDPICDIPPTPSENDRSERQDQATSGGESPEAQRVVRAARCGRRIVGDDKFVFEVFDVHARDD